MPVASAVFVAAGGYIHLDQWLDGYRDVPASAPGSALVRIGFPVNAAVSALLAIGLLLGATIVPRLVQPLVLASIGFQAASLGFLIGSRVGSVLGWTEPTWTVAAEQTRAVEIGALVALTATLLLRRFGTREIVAGRTRRLHAAA